MCGRFQARLKFNKSIWAILGIPEPTWEDFEYKQDNVCPTDKILVLRKQDNEYVFDTVRWGFIQKNNPAPMFNSKIETIQTGTTSQYFQNTLMKSPIVIPMSGFYEWKDLGKGVKKQPYIFRIKDQDVFFVAGYSRVDKDKDGQPITTATIITTIGNEITKPIHTKDRSPVILDYPCVKNFLDGDIKSKLDLCFPFQAERMTAVEEAPN